MTPEIIRDETDDQINLVEGEKICKMISCKEISHDINDDRGFGY